jgi:hypothetical protein
MVQHARAASAHLVPQVLQARLAFDLSTNTASQQPQRKGLLLRMQLDCCCGGVTSKGVNEVLWRWHLLQCVGCEQRLRTVPISTAADDLTGKRSTGCLNNKHTSTPASWS